MIIYLNGELVKDTEARISIYDHGYLYGLGLFETFRTYQGVPFLLQDHLTRLEQSCRHMGFIWRRDDCRLHEMIERLLQENQLADGYFRYNLSAGLHDIGLRSDPYEQLTESLLVKELPLPASSKKLFTVKTTRNTPEGDRRLKSHHYFNNILAKRETPPDAEGVFLTRDGYLAEGVVSNLFFVRAGRLYTPALTTGILNGITRQWVLEAAKRLGIEVEEGEYQLSFAQQADEVFVTNSIQEIVPVTHWDEQSYESNAATQNSITSKLQHIYNRCKGLVCSIQDLPCIMDEEY